MIFESLYVQLGPIFCTSLKKIILL